MKFDWHYSVKQWLTLVSGQETDSISKIGFALLVTPFKYEKYPILNWITFNWTSYRGNQNHQTRVCQALAHTFWNDYYCDFCESIKTPISTTILVEKWIKCMASELLLMVNFPIFLTSRAFLNWRWKATVTYLRRRRKQWCPQTTMNLSRLQTVSCGVSSWLSRITNNILSSITIRGYNTFYNNIVIFHTRLYVI